MVTMGGSPLKVFSQGDGGFGRELLDPPGFAVDSADQGNMLGLGGGHSDSGNGVDAVGVGIDGVHQTLVQSDEMSPSR